MATMSVQFNQAAQEGIYLRFPDNIAPQREINYDFAINLLIRGMAMAQSIPFTWSYIDKPMGASSASSACAQSSQYPHRWLGIPSLPPRKHAVLD